MILVDSDVLIAHLRGIDAARDWMHRARRDSGPLATTVVSVVEIVGGMRSTEKQQVMRLLSSMRVWPVDARAGWRAAELARAYRSSHSRIGLGDFLIAATAETQGMDLATLNVKHFPMFPGLVPPFQLP